MNPLDPIYTLLQTAERDTEGLIGIADRLEDLLKERKLLYTMTIAPRSVGVHPCNRDGEGINPLNVLALAAEIADVGFSLTEVGTRPVCIEAPPDDRTIEEFNVKVSADSGMAAVPTGSIHYGSLSCSHTNYVLRCVADGVPSEDELLAEGGRMSATKISRRDRVFGHVVATGLSWKVIKWEVAYLYPTAIHVISQARNIAGTMNRLETEMQGLLRLHYMAAGYQNRGEEIPWVLVKRRVCRSRPPFAPAVNELAHFVMTRSGGVNGQFLQHLASFVRNHVKSDRTSLPAPFYEAVANMTHQYLGLAVWQAAWLCPPEQVQGGVCKGFTAAEVNALTKSADPATVALLNASEALLAASRDKLAAAGILAAPDSTKLSKTFARLDVSVARLVLQKGGKLPTLAAIAQQFVADLQGMFPDAKLDVLGDLVPAEAPVAATKPLEQGKAEAKVKAEAKAMAGKLTIVEQNVRGEAVDPLSVLRRHGFDLGMFVAAAGSDEVFQIVGHKETEAGPLVSLRSYRVPGRVDEKPLTEFLAAWAPKDVNAVEERHSAWPAGRPKALASFRSIVRRGIVLQALSHMLSTAGADVEQQIAIITKPVRKVVATMPLEIGALVLLPESGRVEAKPRCDAPSPGAVEAKFVPEDAANKYYVLPVNTAESVAPLWLVGTTPSEEQANMVWGSAQVTSINGHDFTGPVLPAEARPGRAGKAADDQGQKKGKGRGKKGKAQKDLPEQDGGVAAPLDEATKHIVLVPYLTNSKPLTAGAELLIFKAAAAPAKREERPMPISVGALIKKARM
jgi:hypothetical protein